MIEVHLLSQSRPIERSTSVKNTYTKEGMYCIMFLDGKVEKYPLCNIFRVVEK